jgi:hypothetical protein
VGAALHGNLSDFGIAEVFQLIGQQRKTGVLEVERGNRTLCIQFHEGSVVVAEPKGASDHAALAEMLVRCGLITRERSAAIGRDSTASARAYGVVAVESGDVSHEEIEQIADLLTRDVIFEVLRLANGSFHFSACSVEHDRSPDRLLGAEQILMEGLRMVDEWRTFASRVPDPGRVVKRSGTLDDYRSRAGKEERETFGRVERIFQLVDGRLTIARVIDLSRIGTFEGMRALAGLLDAGSIEIAQSVLPPVVAVQGRALADAISGVRFALTAALPLLALAGVMWLGGERLMAPAPIPGTSIEPRAFERAAAAFETRRLRHALEAHRHLWSEWPRELAAVDRTGWSGSGGLATPEVDSYYYAHRGGGVILLPPEAGSTR